MAQPAAQLLGNGDILVPVKGEGGDWHVARLEPSDGGYADWLALIQDSNRPRPVQHGLAFGFSLVLLFFGFWVVVAICAGLASAIR